MSFDESPAKLRVYCETLPFEEVTRPRTIALLRRHVVEIVLAVRPWQLAELPRAAETLRDSGVSCSVWPMLADDEGRWASAQNAASFVRFVRSTADVLASAGALPREVLLDLEPPFAHARALAAGGGGPGGWFGLSSSRPRATSKRAMDVASTELAAVVVDLHDRGIATASAVWPLVALDAPGERGWQALLGTPVDALATGRVSVMMYTSILEGWPDYRTLDAIVRIAPMLGILCMASPFICYTYAARETVPPINDQQLAMCAVVQFTQLIPVQLVIFFYLDSGLLHLGEQLRIHLVAADPIEKDMNFDACATPFSEGVRKFPADCPGPINEGLEGYGLPGTAYCLQHRRENLIAIQQRFNSIAIQHVRTEHCSHRAGKLRIIGAVKARNRMLNAFFTARTGASRGHGSKKEKSQIEKANAYGDGHCAFLDYRHDQFLRWCSACGPDCEGATTVVSCPRLSE